MPNIPELKVGSTTYDLHDKRVDGLKSTLSDTASTLLANDKAFEYAIASYRIGEVISDIASGIATGPTSTIDGDDFVHAIAHVEKGKSYYISGTEFPNVQSVLLLNNGVLVRKIQIIDSNVETAFAEVLITITDDADTMYVNGYDEFTFIYDCSPLKSNTPFVQMQRIGATELGVREYSNNYSNVALPFVHVVAPVVKGNKYLITGTDFPRVYPAYTLLKNMNKVRDVDLTDAASSTEYNFYNVEITITDDADSIVVNGYDGKCSVTAIQHEAQTAAPTIYTYDEVLSEPINGVMYKNGDILTAVGCHCFYHVKPGETVKIRSRQWHPMFPLYVFYSNKSRVIGYNTEVYAQDTWNTVEIEIPDNANCLVLQGNSMTEIPTLWRKIACDTKKYIDEQNTKTIGIINDSLAHDNYWRGKKIVWFGTSIPAGVVNAGDFGGNGSYPTRVGELLGATVYNEAVGSSAARFGDYRYITEDDPHGIRGQYVDNFLYSLSASSAEKQAIFDNWAYWKNVIQEGAGASKNMTEELKAFSKSCSYDIKLAKYLSGGEIGPVDLYVFDHGHNDEYLGGYEFIKTDPPANDQSNRSYFIGAMRFLINLILEDNPKAKICFVGHYEKDRKTGISEAQEHLHDIWGYPLIRTWDYIGWSQNMVTVDGVEKTITQIWMPDDLHPSSDTTGTALKHYAEVLYPLMRDIR